MCGGRLRTAARSALRRVAGAHGGADFDVGQAQRGELGADACERRLEVEADVVGQRLQRRDVDDHRLVGQAARRRPRRTSSSSAARKAVSVLPEPVGAATSVCAAGADRAATRAACASVGAGKCAEPARRRRDGSRPARDSEDTEIGMAWLGSRAAGRGAKPRARRRSQPAGGATRAPSMRCAPAPRRRSRSPWRARRRRRARAAAVAARRRQAHRLLDHHEVAGQQAQAAEPLRVGDELLPDAGGDVGAPGDELVDDARRGRRALDLRAAFISRVSQRS